MKTFYLATTFAVFLLIGSNGIQNFNPEKVLIKEVVEWESPTNFTATFFNLDGTKRGEHKWTREKK
jgi:hypothetical protein